MDVDCARTVRDIRVTIHDMMPETILTHSLPTTDDPAISLDGTLADRLAAMRKDVCTLVRCAREVNSKTGCLDRRLFTRLMVRETRSMLDDMEVCLHMVAHTQHDLEATLQLSKEPEQPSSCADALWLSLTPRLVAVKASAWVVIESLACCAMDAAAQHVSMCCQHHDARAHAVSATLLLCRARGKARPLGLSRFQSVC